MKRPQILIYAKPPRIGLSKTRLAKGFGSSVKARRIAMALQAKTLRAALNGPWQTVLYTAPDTALTTSLGGIWPAHLARRSQGPGGLGARLTKGFDEAPAGPVLFIGSDAPDISTALLRQAVRALSRHDAVFGPAQDGGFWLFGINKSDRTPSPFEDVRWSGPHAMEDVWANLPERAKVAVLPQLIDIDDAQDWEIWHGRHAAEIEDHKSEQTQIAEARKKPGFFARLFGRK
ncbi:MAG: TIGR04282 family arsenosugar biosynthesis glycosyltransferase [Pseudomonadota bacterium]